MSNDGRSFGCIDREWIMSGVLSRIRHKPAALAVLLIHLAHADWQTGEAYPGQKTIAKATGLTERGVQKARQTLKAHGLLEDTGKRRGVATVWRTPQIPEQAGGYAGPSTPVHAGQTPQPSPAGHPRGDRLDTPGPSTPAQAGRGYPNGRDADTRTGGRVNRTGTEQRTAAEGNKPAAAGMAGQTADRQTPPADAAVLAALDAAGIGEPTRSKLAAEAGITRAMVADLAAKAQAAGKRPGALVRNIEAACRNAAALPTMERWWDGMPPEEQARWRAFAIAKAPATAEWTDARRLRFMYRLFMEGQRPPEPIPAGTH